MLIEYPIEADVDPGCTRQGQRRRPATCIASASRPGRASQSSFGLGEDETDRQHVALTNVDDGTIPGLPERQSRQRGGQSGGMAEVVKRKRALEQVAVELQQRQQQMRDISETGPHPPEHGPTGPQHGCLQELCEKFSEQEAEIEKLHGRVPGSAIK